MVILPNYDNYLKTLSVSDANQIKSLVAAVTSLKAALDIKTRAMLGI